MSHDGASLSVQMPHCGVSERVKMAILRDKESMIIHKYFFFGTWDSSTAKTATLSRTVHAFLSLISYLQVKTTLQIYFEYAGAELYATLII